MKPFEAGFKKVENLSFELEARKAGDKVLEAKADEVQVQLGSLKTAENKVKTHLATLKYYFKDLSQEKKVDSHIHQPTNPSAMHPTHMCMSLCI